MTEREMYNMIEEEMITMGWLEEGLTEEQCEGICAHCPFGGGGQCCYGCAVWEELMGEDL